MNYSIQKEGAVIQYRTSNEQRNKISNVSNNATIQNEMSHEQCNKIRSTKLNDNGDSKLPRQAHCKQ